MKILSVFALAIGLSLGVSAQTRTETNPAASRTETPACCKKGKSGEMAACCQSKKEGTSAACHGKSEASAPACHGKHQEHSVAPTRESGRSTDRRQRSEKPAGTERKAD